MWTPESLDPCAISGSGSVFGIIASDTFFFATHSSPNQDDYGGIGSILSKVGVLKMPDKTRECSLVEF